MFSVIRVVPGFHQEPPGAGIDGGVSCWDVPPVVPIYKQPIHRGELKSPDLWKRTPANGFVFTRQRNSFDMNFSEYNENPRSRVCKGKYGWPDQLDADFEFLPKLSPNSGFIVFPCLRLPPGELPKPFVPRAFTAPAHEPAIPLAHYRRDDSDDVFRRCLRPAVSHRIGLAKGVETVVERVLAPLGLPLTVIPPSIQAYVNPKQAYSCLVRNALIMLELSFQTRALRTICEQDTVAQEQLGSAAAEALRHRIEDLRASRTIFDLLVGDLRPENGTNGARAYLLSLADDWVLRFVPNHAKPPMTEQGTVDWKRVNRIQITSIERNYGRVHGGSETKGDF